MVLIWFDLCLINKHPLLFNEFVPFDLLMFYLIALKVILSYYQFLRRMLCLLNLMFVVHPRSSVVFSLNTEIFVEAFTFSISIILLISEPEVMDEIWSHSLILMNDIHSYEVFIFPSFGIFKEYSIFHVL